MPVFTSACPRNCYSTCSLKVTVENGRIDKIEPHPENKATPEGVCIKGLSYLERIYSPERILHPLQRKPGLPGFEKITWDEALATIEKKLTYYKKHFGPKSVFYYAGSGTKGLLNAVAMNFWRLYGGCTTTYGDLCWPAGLEATRLTLGENKHNAPWDLANARLIILWGKNPAETNIHQMLYLNRALENGGRLIVIDPRRTPSSERAELLIQPRPGTDGALALAIAHALIKNNTINHSFIDTYVHGFDKFKKSVQDFTPEKASAITGVPVNYLNRLAEYLGTIKPVTINAGFGMQRYSNSGQTLRAIITLLALTGNIGVPGAGWLFADLQTSIFAAVKDPVAFYPPDQPDGNLRISISVAKLGQDLLATTEPPIKMIWVERGNPVTQNPETNTVLAAFRAVDFRVVIEQFFTDTALEADMILPAKSMFEQSDIIGAYWHPYLQLKQKVIEPPGQVKPESEVYYLLARRLGFASEEIQRYIPGPSDAEIDAFLADQLRPFPGLTLERLKQGPVLVPGHQEIAFSDFIFPTPSGKIEIYSMEAKKRWHVDPLPCFTEPLESTGTSSRESQKYPLYLMTPNTKNRIHSQFHNLQLIQDLGDRPCITIHPLDAQKRHIKNNMMVRVFNDRGELQLAARLDFGIKPGCIAVTNGWWIGAGGTVNFCSYGRETDMGYGAAFHDNLVEVARIS